MSMFSAYLTMAKSPAPSQAAPDEDNKDPETDGKKPGEDDNEDPLDMSGENISQENSEAAGDLNQGEGDIGQTGEGLSQGENGDMSDMDDGGDHDGDGDISSELAQLSEEMQGMESYIEALTGSAEAIREHGMHPSTFAVLQATRLLSGTALESLALESVQTGGPDDDFTKLALEALDNETKEKSKTMVARILGFIKNTGGKVMATLGKLWDKISSSAKKAASSIKETAKAHPYATVAGAVVAVAAVATVVAYAGGNLPGMTAKPEMFANFNKHMQGLIEKIKWPFSKIKATIVGEKLKVAVDNAGGTSMAVEGAAESTSKLGWSKTAINSITSQLDRGWAAIKTAFGALGTRASRMINGAAKALDAAHPATLFAKMVESEEVGDYKGYFKYLVYCTASLSVCLTLLSSVINGAYRLVANTFSAITGSSASTEA